MGQMQASGRHGDAGMKQAFEKVIAKTSSGPVVLIRIELKKFHREPKP